MSKNLILDVIRLTHEGWQPYGENPQREIYKRLACPHASGAKPFWFFRDKTFLCVGCRKCCLLHNPAGFILPLPVRIRREPPTLYNISPREMLERHDLLTVRQAAYCLNIAERTIYDYIAEGKLTRLKENPVRVRASDVKALRENFDE